MVASSNLCVAALVTLTNVATTQAVAECVVSEPTQLGNGYCNAQAGTAYNTQICDWDGGDCCESTCVSTASYTCGENIDGDFIGYPQCQECIFPVAQLGDGICDEDGNTYECSWDGGDCCDTTCVGTSCGLNGDGETIGFPLCSDPDYCSDPNLVVGNGYCNGPSFNTAACDWDGGDCCEASCVGVSCGLNEDGEVIGFNSCQDPLYPYVSLPEELENCPATSMAGVGNGICDSTASVADNLNSEACAWDFGDCCPQTCDDSACTSAAGADFDCKDPSVMNVDYGPNCNVEVFSFLADGYCDLDGGYNTAACSWDGGDCCIDTCEDTVVYPCGAATYSCLDPTADDYGECPPYVDGTRQRVGNGICDNGLTSVLNTATCDWDGGDCCPSTCVAGNETCGNYWYSCLDPTAAEVGTQGACVVEYISYLGDGQCDFTGDYNTAKCNWDDGDCCPSSCRSSDYTCGAHVYQCINPDSVELADFDGPCEVRPLSYVGDGYCDANTEGQNTRRCSWDGGDCCAASCESGPFYTCGYTYVNSVLTFTGYDNCLDPVNRPNTTTTTSNLILSGSGSVLVDTGPDAGLIAGVVIVVLVVIAVVVVVVWFVVLKKGKGRQYEVQQDEPGTGHHKPVAATTGKVEGAQGF